MSKELIEQSISKGIREKIDNFALQQLISITKEAKLKKDDLVVFRFGVCPFNNKQYIAYDNKDKETEEKCFFCEKPVNEEVVAYMMDERQLIYCLLSEAEELVKQREKQ